MAKIDWDPVYRQGYMGPSPIKHTYQYMRQGDRVEEIRTITVHEFLMGDVEDPDLYAAEPLIKWERSEQGQWIMANAVETPSWHRMADVAMMGYKYQIRAKLTGPALTEWLLRYGDHRR